MGHHESGLILGLVKKGRAVVLSVVVACAGVGAFLYSQRPETITGPSTYQILYKDRDSLNKAPIIDLNLFGLQVQFPKSLPDWSGQLEEDWAGVLFVPDVQLAHSYWVIEGRHSSTLNINTDSGTYVYVPYAPAQDNRLARVDIDGEMVEVTLPYKPDRVPKQLEVLRAQAGPYIIVATPEPRRVRASGVYYTFAVEGQQEGHMAIGTLAYDGGQDVEWATLFGPNHFWGKVFVPTGGKVVVEALIYKIESTNVPVTIKREPSGVTLLHEGNALISPDKLPFRDRGYIGLFFDDEIYFGDGSTARPVSSRPHTTEAYLFKAKGEGHPFVFELEDTQQP